jgi:hypothetical protein
LLQLAAALERASTEEPVRWASYHCLNVCFALEIITSEVPGECDNCDLVSTLLEADTSIVTSQFFTLTLAPVNRLKLAAILRGGGWSWTGGLRRRWSVAGRNYGQ